MYTSEALLDLHERCHISLKKLLLHCQKLGAEERTRKLQGFGYPTVLLQLHHVIAAEKYWVSVLAGSMLIDDDPSDDTTIDSMCDYRKDVFEATVNYLRGASAEELNTARTMTTWGNKERTIVPAHVLLRTQTHIFQHQGQILAMCRLLGKPASGLDFPLE